MDKFLKRAKVVARNLLTYLVLAQTLLTFLLAEGLLDQWPDAVTYITIALTWIGAVVVFIRRVTPVEKDQRGLLPVEHV